MKFWRFSAMFNQLSRSITALALVWALLAGGASVTFAQKKASQSEKAAAEQKAREASEKQDREDALEAANAKKKAEASKGKPLSTDEDPNQIGKRKINGGFIASMSGSIEKEVSLGRELAAEVDRQAKFIDDPVITEYVNRVGQNVVLHSDAKIPFTIKVIDADEVNAFALPGGFFYVNKGLLLAADNEAEIAGVMAHEIAHVAARHAMENIAKANLWQGLAMAGSIFLGGIPGLIYQNTAGLGLAALFSKFSRSAESEADRLGTQYLYAAGYDPNAMATMFEKLASKNKKKPGFFAKTFASHPQSIERLEASRVLVGRFPEREEYVVSTSEFQRVKGRLLRLSNAKASTAGNIAGGGDDGGPRRPTLKRRSPAPDPTTGTGDQKEQKQEAPKLKRATDNPNPQPTDKP
ncbi:MAG TPA: M48 family metallopeptidase [Pyrinomonadaceae bacterium]|nr:M48 family metallopeptidase [Pyrinomonadaceae bacterium]